MKNMEESGVTLRLLKSDVLTN